MHTSEGEVKGCSDSTDAVCLDKWLYLACVSDASKMFLHVSPPEMFTAAQQLPGAMIFHRGIL